MNIQFGEQLRRRRIEKGISQQGLADMLYVDRSSVSGWETGRRIPDADMISRLSDCLEISVEVLLLAAQNNSEELTIILVDDENIILEGEVSILEETIPDADIYGFTVPSEAIEFVKNNKVQIVFLDIEIGRASGMDMCREFMKINPHIHVIFLTCYPQYALEAWNTSACGFLLKPLSPEAVKKQLSKLRWLVKGLV